MQFVLCSASIFVSQKFEEFTIDFCSFLSVHYRNKINLFFSKTLLIFFYVIFLEYTKNIDTIKDNTNYFSNEISLCFKKVNFRDNFCIILHD